MIINNPYKNDFDHAPDKDRWGRFRDRFYYTGDIYVLPFDKKEKKKTAIYCLLFAIVTIIFIIVQGLINQSSSRTIWVVLPYVCQLLPAIYFFIGFFEYAFASNELKRSEYDKSIQRMRHSMLGLIVLTATGALCEIIYLIRFSEMLDAAAITKEIIFLAIYFATFAVALIYSRFHNRYFMDIVVKNVADSL